MADTACKGMIADIQRFSLHDGPGIRTTVFLKGCNLRCAWCHNPETIAFQPQVLLRPDKCIHCGGCAEGCFAGARVNCGRERTVGDVMAEILLDAPYYGADGGVTISGGEPLCQPDFTLNLLTACEEAGVHGALESNLSLPWPVIEPVLRHCRLLMADLKCWDSTVHERYTGAPNEAIKANLMKAAGLGLPLLLRTPVVPGVNDREEEIAAIAAFASQLKTLVCYELLPYHSLGLAKGSLEGYTPTVFEKPAAEVMLRLGKIAANAGIPVRIAGKPVQ
jgi:pyruvate-formate lyase-activating enzyme